MHRHDRIRLAASAAVDPRTVERWLESPDRVSRSSATVLERAAAELGLLEQARSLQAPPGAA